MFAVTLMQYLNGSLMFAVVYLQIAFSPGCCTKQLKIRSQSKIKCYLPVLHQRHQKDLVGGRTGLELQSYARDL